MKRVFRSFGALSLQESASMSKRISGPSQYPSAWQKAQHMSGSGMWSRFVPQPEYSTLGKAWNELTVFNVPFFRTFEKETHVKCTICKERSVVHILFHQTALARCFAGIPPRSAKVRSFNVLLEVKEKKDRKEKSRSGEALNPNTGRYLKS